MIALTGDEWAGICFVAGACAGGAVLALVARRRGHVRMTVELGDPPERPVRDDPPPPA